MSLPGAEVPKDLSEVSNLHELQLWFEQYIAARSEYSLSNRPLRTALLACEKSHSSLEILSVLSALVVRLGLVGAEPSPSLRIAGLYYASQSFSAPALQYHIAALQIVDGQFSSEIIQCLLRTLRTIRLTNPAYDTRSMLAVVTGEGSGTTNLDKCLMDIVHLDYGSYSTAMELLCELGTSKTHEELWKSIVKRLIDRPSSPLIDDAYKCILAFLRVHMTKYATSCMTQLIKILDDVPPCLPVASELAARLNEQGVQVPAVIEKPILHALSQALNEDTKTTSTEDTQLEDGMIDFSIVQSLLGRISQHGSSSSASQIAMIIDALNDCEGALIPLFTEIRNGRKVEFGWAPNWVPVISSSDSVSFSPTLGLLRAQIVTRGFIPSLERCRNLIQLGHLVQRETSPEKQIDPSEDDMSSTWKLTGYLVAFDRVSAEYLVIYMGEDMQIVDPDFRQHVQQNLSDEIEQHALLGSLSCLVMPDKVADFNRDIAEVVRPVQNAANRYFLDLDPGDSLQP